MDTKEAIGAFDALSQETRVRLFRMIAESGSTGMRAGQPILAMLEGRAVPTMTWGNRPMLPHGMRQGTADPDIVQGGLAGV